MYMKAVVLGGFRSFVRSCVRVCVRVFECCCCYCCCCSLSLSLSPFFYVSLASNLSAVMLVLSLSIKDRQRQLVTFNTFTTHTDLFMMTPTQTGGRHKMTAFTVLFSRPFCCRCFVVVVVVFLLFFEASFFNKREEKLGDKLPSVSPVLSIGPL